MSIKTEFSTPASTAPASFSALDRARHKAYLRLLPLLFVCYVIAYVDRATVAIAKLTMAKDLPGFTNAVIGTGAGVFFLGYFLLEIPGTLIVERWSARKWICRIMITWGLIAALTAAVRTPFQFYVIRFLLGLAEAGFFPGVIVYLTHWFTNRDRARALSLFLIATPVAQVVSPKISNALLKIGMTEQVNGHLLTHPTFLGMVGWQWVYIFWGIPAVLLGCIVFAYLTDKPEQARWLADDERQALCDELEREKLSRTQGKRLTLLAALGHPKVLLLGAAYFCIVTGSYGIEFFMPSILKQWYNLKLDVLTWLVILPPFLGLLGQLFVGWNSDRIRERRLHTCFFMALASCALAVMPSTRGHLPLTLCCFMAAYVGFKAYMPSFWSLPSLFLSETAAAGSIGLINSIGNLGGFLGPFVLGKVQTVTGSFVAGLYFLCASMALSAIIIFTLGVGRKEPR